MISTFELPSSRKHQTYVDFFTGFMKLSFCSIFAMSCLVFLLPSLAQAEAPMSVAGAKTIDTEQAKKFFDEGMLFVDTRNSEIFNGGHIQRAVHLDLQGRFTKSALSSMITKDDGVVLYCDGANCGRSAIAAQKAVRWGFSKVYYYRDGYPVWKESGYPVEQ
jgi:rhodanese-related sulfurtransferase